MDWRLLIFPACWLGSGCFRFALVSKNSLLERPLMALNSPVEYILISPIAHPIMELARGNPVPLIFTSLRWWWLFWCVYDPFTWWKVAAFVPVFLSHCAAATSLK